MHNTVLRKEEEEEEGGGNQCTGKWMSAQK
jgi:hypothetical protein